MVRIASELYERDQALDVVRGIPTATSSPTDADHPMLNRAMTEAAPAT